MRLNNDSALTAPEMLACRCAEMPAEIPYPAEPKRTANLEQKEENNEAI